MTPTEAEKLVLENITLLPAEECPLAQAHTRVLRLDVRADRDLPPYDRVTMDGYALRASSLAEGVRTFRSDTVQAAGMRAATLGADPNACIEIMTGAVLPAGADCVVPYEETTRAGADVTVEEAGAKARAGSSVHRRGSDHRHGDVVLRAGTRLGGREIAVAAACGCAKLTVSRLPKIAVVATGDELVEVEAIVAPHQVRRSNDYALRAALTAAGYPQVERFLLHDMRHEIEHQLWHIIAEFDAVLLTGGVSKGKFDFLPSELDKQGVKKILHGVAQRPGKPFWFGVSARATPVFALPGNPASAYTCFHRYVLPGLARASGLHAVPPRLVALTQPVRFMPNLAYLLPVKLASGPKAELLATPVPGNTSGDFSSLIATDGFVELPAEQNEFPAGYIAPFRSWV